VVGEQGARVGVEFGGGGHRIAMNEGKPVLCPDAAGLSWRGALYRNAHINMNIHRFRF
jgi:hypothetical protein